MQLWENGNKYVVLHQFASTKDLPRKIIVRSLCLYKMRRNDEKYVRRLCYAILPSRKDVPRKYLEGAFAEYKAKSLKITKMSSLHSYQTLGGTTNEYTRTKLSFVLYEAK